MLVPVVPLPACEAEVPAGHREVSLGPVPRVGAHRPPLALHQNLEIVDLDERLKYQGLIIRGKEVVSFKTRNKPFKQ